MSFAGKVLVVDDDAHIRQALQATLEGAGYSVRVAEDGRQGVDLCRSWRPDLVLMDLIMPVMDGHLASIEIKYDDELKDTKLVILTADPAEDSRSEGLGHGADAYVRKPFHGGELVKLVDSLLHPLGRSSAVPEA